jgi:arabinofuranosyltransferase
MTLGAGKSFFHPETALPKTDTKLPVQLWLMILLAVLARTIFWLKTGYTSDDAFITYRYVQNILAGNGFVYNPGERVLGSSTPLFTL